MRACVFYCCVIASLLCTLGGCSGFGYGSAGSLRAQSLGDDPVLLVGDFKTAYFSHDAKSGTSFVLSDVPLDEVLAGKMTKGQILHVDLLWAPKAGATPMESTATNATIRYVIIANGEVGVYGGAGFALPSGNPESKTYGLTLRDASLLLQDTTPGFNDLLSPAQLTGTFTAVRDDQKTRQMQAAASQLVTNALGRTRYVLDKPPLNLKADQFTN